ncbi:efflux RND transporter periplasmic adaptor subunit [Maridesulfovibrio salexigens]|uniref:Efflux transporter, RND family, MFP subunit n=1 Tax=Maridesulfovibrio salexigens (strain ATCC 14822 / DSM 2638 / NCIMB 8403 / VKM B-1763) TaxID=526222 RepID=C6C1C5_MARSD|nr:efflux RND transporter periplasmic adaptor subunit [Maridesulfovibrio salexigens]ACS81100.1 efflux transporter, RND family, MFP subunit [Maridesulfovibrio salexigens DSM 2638]
MAKKILYYVKQIGLKGILPLLIVVVAVIGAKALLATKPVAKKKAPVVSAPLVNVSVLEVNDFKVSTPVMGTVEAAREINLEPQVSGKVISVSDAFIPGGYFEKGAEVLRIDPLDYELAVKQQEAVVTEAEYNLKLESGQQRVAGREWKLLKKSSGGTMQEAELALRKPHLQKAQADLASAKAKLKQARIDLARTRVKAPFSCMIVSKSADLGAHLSLNETIASLVGTDEFWVIVSVPVDRLGSIDIPSAENGFKGSKARVRMGSGKNAVEREGEVLRLLPSLESKGRMARIIVSVKDPLNLKGGEVRPLLLGSYVNVQIDSGVLEKVIAIPRASFRDNNTIWVMNEDGLLDIRTVDPVWRDQNYVYLDTGVTGGEKLVVTDISAPLQNMKLRENGSGSMKKKVNSNG